jgi:hypothetical protein
MASMLIILFHVFLIFMLTAFVLLNAMAANGYFDTWQNRYLPQIKDLK